MRTTLRRIAVVWALVCGALSIGGQAMAAPYAAMVMDARTGEVLHARNADTRLHPASLTKMMTLYVAFEAVRLGEISLDTQVRISSNAAAEPPSKLGLRSGQRIRLRYLLRASAVKSANDAATAIAEAVGGTEAAFIARMNRTAKALGMRNTTFKNAHGLTQSGHLSTARDMTIMGRHILYDYPQYYNLFSRRTTDAGTKTVRNTNIRLLENYPGADGIKTGYTRAAGFNLVASAERGSERVIATVFGGRSSTTRNARVAELLNMGFERAPSRVAERPPSLPVYNSSNGAGTPLVAKSMRPLMRPDRNAPDVLVAEATPEARPQVTEMLASRSPDIEEEAAVLARSAVPASRPLIERDTEEAPPVVVTRETANGQGGFGIKLELQPSRFAAERLILRTALQELDTLDDALRRIDQTGRGYQPSFEGLSRTEASRACTRLMARHVQCAVVGS